MARRIRFFSSQVEKESIPIRPLEDSVPLVTVGPRVAQTMDELDVKLAEHEARLIQMNESYQTLSTRTRELQEAKHVLRETAVFFDRVGPFLVYSGSVGADITHVCVGSNPARDDSNLI
jgi:V-type H+-transporting ATPase subunit a